jgi:hypothetical protein
MSSTKSKLLEIRTGLTEGTILKELESSKKEWTEEQKAIFWRESRDDMISYMDKLEQWRRRSLALNTVLG